VIQVDGEAPDRSRATFFSALRAEGIGANVHYIPVPWHPYYQRRGCRKGDWPVAERAYERMLSLPMFPAMTDADVEDVIVAVGKITGAFRRAAR
jgi:dTDP-4-amino-4,6-dideoxygalactose transaminase